MCRFTLSFSKDKQQTISHFGRYVSSDFSFQHFFLFFACPSTIIRVSKNDEKKILNMNTNRSNFTINAK